MSLALLLFAPQVPSLPSGGVPVIQPDSLVLQGDAKYGTVEKVSVTGQPFASAVRVTTKVVPPSEWAFEVGTDATVSIKKGDVLFASVFVRAIKGQAETGEGRTTLDFQVKGGDWAKSVSHPIPITQTWRRIDIPFVSQRDTPAGGANVAFRLGYGIQTVEIGGLSILNFGNQVAVKDLPKTAIYYRGQEEDAPWRKAAFARIEKIRKGDLALQLVDRSGKPVSGIGLEVRLAKHAFPFGTAVPAQALFTGDAEEKKFKEVLQENFNRVTLENDLKWPYWETWSRKDALRAVDWLQENGYTIRAHNVIWPSWRNSPPDLRNLGKEAMLKRIDAHIDDVVNAVKGKVAVWDVVNEPYANHDVMDLLGPDAMASWFRKVKEVDPKPVLVLNDYPPLDGGTKTNAHLNDFYDRIADLRKRKAPIEAIGFQCHVGGDPISPERVLSGLDRFAKFGIPIQITEFDINTQDREFQARYMRDFMIATFSHPAVSEITHWGFWARRHWLPDGALYDADWTIRPHGKAYVDLVNHTWRTDVKGKTDTSGTFRTRGFYGDYDVTVQFSGVGPKTFKVRFDKGAKPIRLVL